MEPGAHEQNGKSDKEESDQPGESRNQAAPLLSSALTAGCATELVESAVLKSAVAWAAHLKPAHANELLQSWMGVADYFFRFLTIV